MSLRLDIATALRDAGRRADPYELEFMLYIKECLCAYKPRKRATSTGRKQFDFTNSEEVNELTRRSD